jgi:hypothetical protein
MIATLEGLSVRGVVSAIADADTATMASARTIVILSLSRQKRCEPTAKDRRHALVSPFLAAISQENVTAMSSANMVSRAAKYGGPP